MDRKDDFSQLNEDGNHEDITSVLVEAVVASPPDVVDGVSVHRTVVLVDVILARHCCYVGARQGIN